MSDPKEVIKDHEELIVERLVGHPKLLFKLRGLFHGAELLCLMKSREDDYRPEQIAEQAMQCISIINKIYQYEPKPTEEA